MVVQLATFEFARVLSMVLVIVLPSELVLWSITLMPGGWKEMGC